jgi:RNA polymerase sigma-70 factor, ECF subfamily
MTERNEQIIDELLVMECQDGNAQALEHLVWRWQKRLWRYAYRLTGDPEAAWDITQESWLGVIRGLPRLSDPARFRPWIYRIVTRKADDWIAGRVRARLQVARMRQQPTPDQSDREALDELQSLLSRLSGPSRTILTLHYLEGLPIADVAGVLDLPEGTVKSRLHAARDELKTLWHRQAWK